MTIVVGHEYDDHMDVIINSEEGEQIFETNKIFSDFGISYKLSIDTHCSERLGFYLTNPKMVNGKLVVDVKPYHPYIDGRPRGVIEQSDLD